MKSILQDERECYICKTPFNLHVHHIISGNANRRMSEEHGFTIYLCGRHHNLSNQGIHFNKELDLKVRRECQAKYEETHTRDDWMSIIGRNYLD